MQDRLRSPAPCDHGSVLVLVVVVSCCTVVVLVDVVSGGAHWPSPRQASQQLLTPTPTQCEPPDPLRHCPGTFTLQDVLPKRLVLQHGHWPTGLPQVDRLAHLSTVLRHSRASRNARISLLMTVFTQR